MTEEANPIFTIGHSTHPIGEFIALLKGHKITTVVDVRSSPYSRVNPQFNKDDLKKSLRLEGIQYVFLGKELGARSEDPAHYQDGRVQYARLAKADRFRSGIARVMSGQAQHRIALMCAEKEPLDCHRTILVARALVESGRQVFHILANGEIEGHDNTMKRLLQQLNMPERDLVSTAEEQIERAYEKQEQRIAYTLEAVDHQTNKAGP